MKKKKLLHIINWTVYALGSGVIGRLVGTLIGWLFRGFLQDEAYAEAHPKKYLLGFIGVTVLACAISLAIVKWPFKMLMDFVDTKIDSIEEADDFED